MASPSCISQDKKEDYWKKKLTKEQYHILREKGTERAFMGKYDGHFEEGIYEGAGCGSQLFHSETKYRSGCGWPAFYDAIPGAVEESDDNTLGMNRIEITCSKCDGHLGHVFNDGPTDTGKRYCVNSVSIDFNKNSNKE